MINRVDLTKLEAMLVVSDAPTSDNQDSNNMLALEFFKAHIGDSIVFATTRHINLVHKAELSQTNVVY